MLATQSPLFGERARARTATLVNIGEGQNRQRGSETTETCPVGGMPVRCRRSQGWGKGGVYSAGALGKGGGPAIRKARAVTRIGHDASLHQL